MALHVSEDNLHVFLTGSKYRAVELELGGPPTRIAKHSDYHGLEWTPHPLPSHRRAWDLPTPHVPAECVLLAERFARLMAFEVPDL